MPAMERFRIGVDENGLGPRLGPLVVTAVIARVTEAVLVDADTEALHRRH